MANPPNPGPLDDKKEALRTYADLVKHQIVLGSAVVALSATFITQAPDIVGDSPLALLIVSWGCLLFSILCGLLFLGRTVILTSGGTYNPDDSGLDWLGRVQQVL